MPMSTQPNASASIVSAAGLAPLLTVLIWSGNAIVTKASAGVISPGSISFYRWLLAFVVLLPFVGRAAWRRDRGHAVPARRRPGHGDLSEPRL